MHGFRCYDNIAPNAKCQRVLASACTRSMPGSFSVNVYGAVVQPKPLREFPRFIWPPTLRPNELTSAVGSPVGCYRPHPPSPFIVSQPESRYSFYRPTDCRKPNRPRHRHGHLDISTYLEGCGAAVRECSSCPRLDIAEAVVINLTAAHGGMPSFDLIQLSQGHFIDKVKTSGQSNLATGRIAAAHGRFNRIRQVAPMCTPSSLEPTQVHTPNGISISSAVFAGLKIQMAIMLKG